MVFSGIDFPLKSKDFPEAFNSTLGVFVVSSINKLSTGLVFSFTNVLKFRFFGNFGMVQLILLFLKLWHILNPQ
jgi:hypothetical protein